MNWCLPNEHLAKRNEECFIGFGDEKGVGVPREGEGEWWGGAKIPHNFEMCVVG